MSTGGFGTLLFGRGENLRLQLYIYIYFCKSPPLAKFKSASISTTPSSFISSFHYTLLLLRFFSSSSLLSPFFTSTPFLKNKVCKKKNDCLFFKTGLILVNEREHIMWIEYKLGILASLKIYATEIGYKCLGGGKDKWGILLVGSYAK